MGIKFGVAGFPPNFGTSPYKKKRENIFEWLHTLGLDWIELQNTYGVKMPEKQALAYRALAEQYGIGISIHAPYYISFASRDPEVVQRSKERMLQCFHLAHLLGSERIIFHPGYPPSQTERETGVLQVIDALQSLEPQVPANVFVYPETAGKRNQVGSLRDILTICGAVSYARPCFDLAHIHAFHRGGLKHAELIQRVFDRAIDRLGPDVLNQMHIHMYPVEYDDHGEKKHKAFADRSDAEGNTPYYPTAEDFVSVLSKLNPDTVVICEARDTQDVGAMLMKRLLYGDKL